MTIQTIQGDCLEVLKTMETNSIESLVTDPPAGISFMGKSWDSDKGGRKEWVSWLTEVMRECLRVLKPGAHGLVWAIPRTSHWTATALEDAGFEIRDVITHLFGSGFPKSLDVSKAIDKAAGVEGPIVGKNPAYRERQLEHDARWETAMRPEFKRGPATDAAKQWQGWGTALKPASEHWILVRKPISEKTVAANILKWGTGALNIDASRVEGIPTTFPKPGEYPNALGIYPKTSSKREAVPNTQGRFPANLVLSHSPHCEESQCDIDCAVAMLDAQASSHMNIHAAGNKRTGIAGKTDKSMFGIGSTDAPVTVYNDKDASKVSRFFYCAKVSSSERNAGLENTKNVHPTVKPQKLMRYLCRMITPPEGLILDPFMGSGSTGCASVEEGFSFIGIEQDEDYHWIAKRRIEHAADVAKALKGGAK